MPLELCIHRGLVGLVLLAGVRAFSPTTLRESVCADDSSSDVSLLQLHASRGYAVGEWDFESAWSYPWQLEASNTNAPCHREMASLAADMKHNRAHPPKVPNPEELDHDATSWAMSKSMFDYLGEKTRPLMEDAQNKVVCETGFRYGTTAMAFLCSGAAKQVRSYNLRQNKYVSLAKEGVNARYPGQLVLVHGDSQQMIRDSVGVSRWNNCDVAFVEGGRTYEIVSADIENFAKVATPGATLLVDGCGNKTQGPRKAFDDAVAAGLVVKPSYDSPFSEMRKKTICVGHYTGGQAEQARSALKTHSTSRITYPLDGNLDQSTHEQAEFMGGQHHDEPQRGNGNDASKRQDGENAPAEINRQEDNSEDEGQPSEGRSSPGQFQWEGQGSANTGDATSDQAQEGQWQEQQMQDGKQSQLANQQQHEVKQQEGQRAQQQDVQQQAVEERAAQQVDQQQQDAQQQAIEEQAAQKVDQQQQTDQQQTLEQQATQQDVQQQAAQQQEIQQQDLQQQAEAAHQQVDQQQAEQLQEQQADQQQGAQQDVQQQDLQQQAEAAHQQVDQQQAEQLQEQQADQQQGAQQDVQQQDVQQQDIQDQDVQQQAEAAQQQADQQQETDQQQAAQRDIQQQAVQQQADQQQAAQQDIQKQAVQQQAEAAQQQAEPQDVQQQVEKAQQVQESEEAIQLQLLKQEHRQDDQAMQQKADAAAIGSFQQDLLKTPMINGEHSERLDQQQQNQQPSKVSRQSAHNRVFGQDWLEQELFGNVHRQPDSETQQPNYQPPDGNVLDQPKQEANVREHVSLPRQPYEPIPALQDEPIQTGDHFHSFLPLQLATYPDAPDPEGTVPLDHQPLTPSDRTPEATAQARMHWQQLLQSLGQQNQLPHAAQGVALLSRHGFQQAQEEPDRREERTAAPRDGVAAEAHAPGELPAGILRLQGGLPEGWQSSELPWQLSVREAASGLVDAPRFAQCTQQMSDIIAQLHNYQDNQTNIASSYLDGSDWIMSKPMFGFLGGTAKNELQNTDHKVVCETGFRYGVTALAFLCLGNAEEVRSYNLRRNAFVTEAAKLVDDMYTGKLTLIHGDSKTSLHEAAEAPNQTPCDMAFVEGDRDYATAKADIMNFAKVSVPGALLMVDGCANVNSETRTAFDDAVKQGMLESVSFYSDFAQFDKTVCIARYTGAARSA